MDLDGGRQRLIAEVPGPSSPQFSPDGTQILLTATQPGETARVAVMDSGGGGLEPLPLPAPPPDGFVWIGESYPSWSPDGLAIAFVRGRSQLNGSATQSIVVHDLTTGEETTPYESIGYVSGVSWSPAGDSLLFEDFADPTAADRRRAAISLTLSSGETRIILEGVSSPSYASADRQTLLYVTGSDENSQGGTQVWIATGAQDPESVVALPWPPTSGLSLPACALRGT